MRFDPDDPEIQPYRILPQNLDAPLYNTFRLALLRMANPLIITHPKQKNIDCHLSNSRWIFVDTAMQDFPLLVWRDFITKNRALHEAVICNVFVYHKMAGRLMGTGLYELEDYLNSELLQCAAKH